MKGVLGIFKREVLMYSTDTCELLYERRGPPIYYCTLCPRILAGTWVSLNVTLYVGCMILLAYAPEGSLIFVLFRGGRSNASKQARVLMDQV